VRNYVNNLGFEKTIESESLVPYYFSLLH